MFTKQPLAGNAELTERIVLARHPPGLRKVPMSVEAIGRDHTPGDAPFRRVTLPQVVAILAHHL
jgi:hypothetical protein